MARSVVEMCLIVGWVFGWLSCRSVSVHRDEFPRHDLRGGVVTVGFCQIGLRVGFFGNRIEEKVRDEVVS